MHATGWVPAARPFGDWRTNPKVAHPSLTEIEQVVGRVLGYEVTLVSWGYGSDEELVFQFRVA